MEKKRYYTIASSGLIDVAGGIYGPLTTPTPFDTDTVVKMVRKGLEVYQVNPGNHNEKIRVTTRNVNSIVFKTTRASVAIQRALNKAIQEESKPIVVDVERKNDKKNKSGNDNKTNVVSVSTTETKEETKDTSVTKPDAFSKN